MKKTEQELANELDAFLTAHLQQRPLPPVDGAAQTEAKLAAELLELARKMEPDPVFLSRTEARMARAASRNKEINKQPERFSFWQQLMNTVKENLTMKRTAFALGTLATVLVVGAFAFFWMRGGSNPESDTVAVVPDTAETTDPTTGETTTVDETRPEEPVDDTAPPDVPPVPDTENLPTLPMMGQAGSGRGFGGGGGGAVAESAVPVERPDGEDSDLMIEEPFFWDPLADAQYNVTVPFPVEPVVATVYQQPGTTQFTPEEVQQYAQLFGLNGPVYTEVYPEPVFDAVEGEEAAEELVVRDWTPPTFYFVFDGKRQLSFYETNIYYFDQAVSEGFMGSMMPLAEAAPIAEAFLQERGLLDFSYVTASPYGGDVEFRRIVDGYVNTTAEFYVTVTDQGDVMSVSYQPFDKLSAVGDYPLQTAEEAWQQIMDEGIDYMHSYWQILPDPDSEMVQSMPVEPFPFDEEYRYWNRTFADGDPIVMISFPIVYVPVLDETIAPRIQLDQYLLSGDTALLQAMADSAGQPMRVEGIVRGSEPNQTIDVTAWESFADYDWWQYRPGTVQLDDAQTLFAADDGETFVIPDAPADLLDGERVNVSGWSIEDGDGTYRVFNWAHIDVIIEWNEPPVGLPEPMPVEPIGDPYQITDVTITEIELVYQYSPVFEEDGMIASFFLQPAWRFSGTTNTNEIIEIYAQAAASDLVASPEG